MRYMYSPTGRTFLVMLTEYGQAYRTYVAHVKSSFYGKSTCKFHSLNKVHEIKYVCVGAHVC